jgi:hypothetical protein
MMELLTIDWGNYTHVTGIANVYRRRAGIVRTSDFLALDMHRMAAVHYNHRLKKI